MISDKVRRIIHSLIDSADDELLNDMTEKDAWALVYSLKPTKSKFKKGPRVVFSGFSASEKEELKKVAEDKKLIVGSSVGPMTKYLVIKSLEKAGPVKLKKAAELEIEIIQRQDFEALSVSK